MRLVESCRGPFWVWDQDQLGQQLEAKTWWDQHLRVHIDAVAAAKPDGWAVDLGANVGWFTTYLAERFGSVLALEAHPGTYELLMRNIESRGLGNVAAIQRAAYDWPRIPMAWVEAEMIGWPVPADLNLTPNASSVALVPEVDGTVRSAAVDRYLLQTAEVALIKVDVQGCDLRALKGCRETIARCRPTIIFEFEEAASLWHGDTWHDYLAFFEARDYDVSPIWATDFLAVPR